MTDEKKKLPWHCICEQKHNVYWGHDERRSFINGRFVPEREAIRLHALDEKFVEYEVLSKLLKGSITLYKERVNELCERVKKFEEAAKVIIEFDDGEAFEDWNLEPLQVLKAGIKNLREAMGDK